MWDMTHSCETWLIHKTTRLKIRRGVTLFWNGTWLGYMRHDSFMWDMMTRWLINEMTHEWDHKTENQPGVSPCFEMRHDSVTWDMTHSCEIWWLINRQDHTTANQPACRLALYRDMPRLHETWLIHVGHDSFTWEYSFWKKNATVGTGGNVHAWLWQTDSPCMLSIYM
jgi:hypothetical protein